MSRKLWLALVALAASSLFAVPAAPALASCPSSSDAYSRAVLANSPVAYYRLDDAAGTAMCDASTSANTGTYAASGITYGVAGAVLKSTDTAVAADGSNGVVGQSNANDPITGNSAFTLEAWFRSTAAPRNQALVDFGNPSNGQIAGLTVWNNVSYDACSTPNGSSIGLDEFLGVNCWDTTTLGVNLYDGAWHDVAVSYDPVKNHLTAYVDGRGLGFQTPVNSGAFNLSASPVRIGHWIDTTINQNVVGDEDEVALYATALSSAKILAHYKAAGYAPAVTSVAPDAGPTAGATNVTITGANFTSNAKVKFGTTPATSVSVLSPTQIQATSPAHVAGTVHVVVSTPVGPSKTSNADLFAYGPPSVASLSPTAGPTTGKTAVTITGTGFVPGATVSFGSTASTKVTFVSATKLKAVAPAEPAGPVDVTVTTLAGTSATSAADVYTYAPKPTVTGVSPSGGPAAGGTAVTVTGTNFTPGSTVKFGTASATSVSFVSSTQLTATAPAHAAGTVDVKVTAQGGTSATNVHDRYTYGP